MSSTGERLLPAERITTGRIDYIVNHEQGERIPEEFSHALRVIDPWLRYQREINGIPGMAVGIVNGSNVVFREGYGYANKKTKEKVTAKTGFRIASITKLFTAISVMQLYEQGKLDLTAPIIDYLPWVGERENIEDNMTVMDLFAHISGLKRDANTPHGAAANYPDKEGLKDIFRGEDVFLTKPLDETRYSNLALALGGQLVEAVDERPLEEYFREEIAKPAGMNDIYTDLTEDARRNLATGYEFFIPKKMRRKKHKKREEAPLQETRAMEAAFGGIFTIDDLCSFIPTQFDGDERLVSDISKELLHGVGLEDGSGAFGFQTWKVGDTNLVGHGGTWHGYRSNIAIDKKNRTGMVTLTNTSAPEAVEFNNTMIKIINYFKQNKDYFQRGEGEEIADFSQYEGIYTGLFYNFQIIQINNKLIGINLNDQDMMENCTVLEPTDTVDTFKIDKDPSFAGENTTFYHDRNGNVVGLLRGTEPAEKDKIRVRKYS